MLAPSELTRKVPTNCQPEVLMPPEHQLLHFWSVCEMQSEKEIWVWATPDQIETNTETVICPNVQKWTCKCCSRSTLDMLPLHSSQATHEAAFIKNPSVSSHTSEHASQPQPPIHVCPSLICRWLMTGIEERTSCEGVNAWMPPSLPAPLLYDFKLPHNSLPPLFSQLYFPYRLHCGW